MKRFTALLLILLMTFTLLCSCAKEQPAESSEPEAVISQSEPEPEPEKIYNPLTGLSGFNAAAVGKRPVAVMINNIVTALPQYGICAADIMFEIPVEGEITRMMAVYSDYTAMSNVCSIRSCRYYYPIFALGLDAIYLHWGIDEDYASPVVYDLGVDRLDGDALGDPLFGRDPNRTEIYDWEHTGYLEASLLPQYIEEYEFRTDKQEQYATAFKFLDEGAAIKPSANNCDTAVLNFSSSYFSTFTYDAEQKVYYKQHSGSPHMDQASGEQLNYTNIFVLETDIGLLDDGYHRYVDWSGGTGYYISNGAYIEITWEKADEFAPIIIKYASTGDEVVVNAGKSYIGIIYPESTELIDSSAITAE